MGLGLWRGGGGVFDAKEIVSCCICGESERERKREARRERTKCDRKQRDGQDREMDL